MKSDIDYYFNCSVVNVIFESSNSIIRIRGKGRGSEVIVAIVDIVTGEAFFAALVENLSKAMDTHSAWVTEYIETSHQLRALAFWADGQLLTDFMVDMDGTTCGDVIEHAEFIHHTKNIDNVYPKDFLRV